MEAARDEIPFGLDEGDSNTLAALRIALASLEAEPAIHRWRRVTSEPYGPYPWHYGDFIGFSKPVDGIEDEYFTPPARASQCRNRSPAVVTQKHRAKSRLFALKMMRGGGCSLVWLELSGALCSTASSGICAHIREMV